MSLKSPFGRLSLATGAALIVLTAGVIVSRLWRSVEAGPRSPTVAELPRVAPSQARRTGVERAGPLLPRQAAPGGARPLASSLQGTEIDGWLGVDDDGHLVVTPGARWFFDYFLSATGEESALQIRSRIVGEIERRLPAAGAQEAIALLDHYLAYRERVRGMQDSGPPRDLGQRLRQLHEIRLDVFGQANAAALFGEEEQVEAIDIQRREVLSDKTLPPEERQRRLDEMENQLPEGIRQARGESMAAVRLMQDEQKLRDAGGSAEDIRALREQHFGSEAADRLAALDAERAGWQQRLDDYRRARQSIEDDASLTADERARQIDALLAENFTEPERLRVRALDQVRDRAKQ